MSKEYEIKSLTKERDGFLAVVDFGGEVGIRRWMFSRDLSEDDLEKAILKSCEGVFSDMELFAENAERDAREAEDNRKVEGVKSNLGLK